MPAGVGTVSHGVPIAALAEDAATYNPGNHLGPWPERSSYIPMMRQVPLTKVPSSILTIKLETARYYYPNLVECFTAYRQSGDPGDLDTALDNPVTCRIRALHNFLPGEGI